jgi:hypothetical protein
MTDRRVQKIVAIIGRDKAAIKLIEIALLLFDQLETIRSAVWRHVFREKRERLIASSYARALGKLEKRFNELDTACWNKGHRRHAEAILERYTLFIAAPGLCETIPLLGLWRKRLENFSEKKPDNAPRLGPSRPEFDRKHDAVKVAAEILKAHGLPLTATRKAGTRKASAFCQVAAIVSGERDLYHQCRQFLKIKAPEVLGDMEN